MIKKGIEGKPWDIKDSRQFHSEYKQRGKKITKEGNSYRRPCVKSINTKTK